MQASQRRSCCTRPRDKEEQRFHDGGTESTEKNRNRVWETRIGLCRIRLKLPIKQRLCGRVAARYAWWKRSLPGRSSVLPSTSIVNLVRGCWNARIMLACVESYR